MQKRPRVLVVAKLCNPEWHSVPLVGWNHAWALREHCDVHLVTHWWNAEAIGRSQWPKDEVTYIDLGKADRFYAWAGHKIFKDQWGKASYTAFGIPFHWYFEHLVWRAFRERLARGAFDVVHRLTPVSPVNSGPLAKRCAAHKVPFLYGPINGGLRWPRGYKNALHKEREWISALRFLFHHVPYIRSAREHAAAILVASRTTWEQTPEVYRTKAYYLPENAVHAHQVQKAPRATPELPPLKICFLGRLVPLKCVELALLGAAPLLRDGRATFDVIGDGSERPFLEKLVRDEKLEKAVVFHGEVPNARALEILATMHVLAFPSIREFGGGAVVEAMASGVVPVVMDYGGPGELVDASSGIRLPLEDDARTAARLGEAFARLAATPAALQALGEGARQRVLDAWTWQAKVLVTTAIYRHVAGMGGERPALLPPKPVE